MESVFAFLFLLSCFALLIGLVVPNFFARLFKQNLGRKTLSLLFGGSILICLLGVGIFSETKPEESLTTNQEEIEGQVKGEETSSGDGQVQESEAQDTQVETFRVSRIIDGDTIELEGGQKIRYIGIDTPETNENECFAVQASEKNRELVLGKEVILEKDISETDRYGRLLRYVYLGDVFINELLVKEGYAQASSYPPDIKYQDKFTSAQTEAQNNNLGLWSECNINPTSTLTPTSTKTPTPTTAKTNTPTQTFIPTATPIPAKITTSTGSCKYNCSGPDRDCSDFSTHSEAQQFFECCGFSANNDPMRLDSVGVGDGIACESLP